MWGLEKGSSFYIMSAIHCLGLIMYSRGLISLHETDEPRPNVCASQHTNRLVYGMDS